MTKMYTTHYGENFDKAFSLLMEVEGNVITNDPDDPGGLTACGISKVYQPQWSGWSKIDTGLKIGEIKLNKVLPDSYVSNVVSEFYYTNIWIKYACDLVPSVVGLEIFDQAVNPGPKTMVKNLQSILNTLNYDTKTKTIANPDLVIDGLWGKNTRERLLQYTKQQSEVIALGMNCLQGSYYINLAINSISKRKYIRGWLLRRIELNK